MLYFITGNNKKFEEAREILGVEMEQMDIDLPEIQDMDPHNVVKTKLQEALRHHKGPFIVDDVSVELTALGGLPGPLIKWFLQTLGALGIYEMTEKLGNSEAEAKLIIGYAESGDNTHFFEGSIRGDIVEPRGDSFGWDPIFQPKGSDKTFGEMTREEKNKISHRRIALDKLKHFLENNGK